MFYLFNEATSKDTQLKTQTIVSLNNDQPKGSEWKVAFLVINGLS